MPALSLSGQSRQRQVVILAVGGFLLAALLLFQVPRTLAMLKSDAPPPPSQTTVTPTPVSPVASPGAPAIPVTNPVSSTRVVSLTRFKSKDPFVQQVDPNADAAQSSGASPPTPTPTPTPAVSESRATSKKPTKPGSFRPLGSTATISVNGAEETVKVKGTFPNANPVFKLVSVGAGTVKVGVAKGKLRGGTPTVTLSKGEPLTLLNTVDGKRYKLELVGASK